MTAATGAYDSLQPRAADGLLPGAGLAVVVHVGLIVALALGVNWRHTSETVHSAELWAVLPEVAAPRAVRPEPSPPPPPPATPAPAPAPAPPPARSAVDIAIEKERQAQAERAAQQERARLAEARRAREAEQAALRQQRELQQKRQQELARAAEEARQQALLDQQRKANLDRMLAQADASGGTGRTDSTGSAARDAAPSNAYAGRLIGHIKSQIVMPDLDRLPPSLAAEVEVRATASGTVLSRRLLRPSGNPAWDEAVLRAIDRSGTLPRDTDGRVPTTIRITFRPTD